MSYQMLGASTKKIVVTDRVTSTGHITIDNKTPIADQFKKSNSIYEIRTVIDLKGKSITVPNQCCLFFNGGALVNGTINGNHTRIVAPFGRILGTDIKLNGSFTADCVKISWWGSYDTNDNTIEVQAALDAIMSFDNRILYFDMPVRISDVSLALRYSPGITLVGGSNSTQHSNVITVFGKGSHGLDISGTENIQFRNLQFIGEKDNSPICFLYASRLTDNKQCPGHKFYNVNFRGYATKAFVYNYSGESWVFDNCSFRVEQNAPVTAAYYGTTINTLGERSKFGIMEENINPLTFSEFNGCYFNIKSPHPAVYFEGGTSKKGVLKNITSVYFTKCYFFCELCSSVKMKNVNGNVAFINCVDESGAMNASSRNTAFIDFVGESELDGLTLINNTFYAKNNTRLLNADIVVNSYNSQGNKVINKGGEWHFKKLTNAVHQGLSPIEKFSVDNGKSVSVITTDGKVNNVSINVVNSRPVLSSSDEGHLFYDKKLKKTILWDGQKWVNVDGSKL